MPTYMTQPTTKLTIATVEYQMKCPNIIVDRVENGMDTATVILTDVDAANFESNVDEGDAISVEVKDKNDASWIKIFNGVVTVCVASLNSQEGSLIKLKCDGAAYGFKRTSCGQEYGAESPLSTMDTIKEIVEDATYGIVDKWVERYLDLGSSGYSYTTSVETITGTINYAYFPYKPCNQAVNDLCDLVTAIKAGAAGCHWIVTTDDKFRLKTIGSTLDIWYKYYLNSATDATLEQGVDFLGFIFEKLESEANYILYHGATVKPIGFDKWTENNAADWGSNVTCDVTNDTYNVKGTYSIRMQSKNTAGATTILARYPDSLDLSLNFDKITGEYNVPVLHVWLACDAALWTYNGTINIFMLTDATNYWATTARTRQIFTQSSEWAQVTIPVSANYPLSTNTPSWFRGWTQVNSPDWADINGIDFAWATNTDGDDLYIDNLYFKGYVLRGAKDSTLITNDKAKVKVITDNVAKYDTWDAATDTGTIARLAYKELLRLKGTPLVGRVTVKMLKDLLPGQYVHLHAKKKSDGTFQIDKDFRATRLKHIISMKGYNTTIMVTDDVTNSQPRMAYDDLNKVIADIRPEFQDRQATSFKTRDIDVTQQILEKDYPS